MKLQPEFLTSPLPVSMFDSGNRWFLPHRHHHLSFPENSGFDSTDFAGFHLRGSGDSDSTVLSPAFSPDWSGISSRSTPLVFLCPIDSQSENPCWFLGSIADDWCFLKRRSMVRDLQRFWPPWWSLVVLFLWLRRKMMSFSGGCPILAVTEVACRWGERASILGHVPLKWCLGQYVAVLWRVFLAGEDINMCPVHATRVNEVAPSRFRMMGLEPKMVDVWFVLVC